MKLFKKALVTIFLFAGIFSAQADEGMWALKELNKISLARMQELGFTLSYDQLYSDTDPSLANAVVIFGGGCTGITVSEQALIFTNHHCGFGSIQQLSSVEHDYLKDGFVSQTLAEELPVPGLSVRYLDQMIDVSDRINSNIEHFTTEAKRLYAADSIGRVLSDSIGRSEFRTASVIPFYSNNKYYLVTYKVYKDVRMVFAPPSSVGKFGGDTDNWMWPRHTGDFSVFRVYADSNNEPTNYNKDNRPYSPKYVSKVSMQGFEEKDYAMTIGFPGSTNRYLSSWGVKQRMEDTNAPRIEVRGIKQEIWKEAMRNSDAVRIKYASKYAGSSNYWKNSIGMNRGLERLKIIERKKTEEQDFTNWVNQDTKRKAEYGEIMTLLENGYTETNNYRNVLTYLTESFLSGTEIVRLARTVQSFVPDQSSGMEIDAFIEESILPFFKDYEPELDEKVAAAMLRIAKERVPQQYLPDIYQTIDKKYKGDYEKYAADLFKKTALKSPESISKLLREKNSRKKVNKDPAVQLAQSVMMSMLEIPQLMSKASFNIRQGERLYLKGLQEMHPNRSFYSDANFTMRLSYGSILSYVPFDAAWYNFYSTQQGIFEKENPESDEFNVQPEILDLLRSKNYGEYANKDGDLQVCFLSNNDITGGNSGSPVFDKNGNVIGLAFDGNWEAMSGDIAFEPDLQRCINVDIRYVLYMIDKWGKCPRIIEELTLVK